jgi:hypothetical protein
MWQTAAAAALPLLLPEYELVTQNRGSGGEIGGDGGCLYNNNNEKDTAEPAEEVVSGGRRSFFISASY